MTRATVLKADGHFFGTSLHPERTLGPSRLTTTVSSEVTTTSISRYPRDRTSPGECPGPQMAVECPDIAVESNVLAALTLVSAVRQSPLISTNLSLSTLVFVICAGVWSSGLSAGSVWCQESHSFNDTSLSRSRHAQKVSTAVCRPHVFAAPETVKNES